MNVTLDNANAVVAAALAEGRRLKLMPLSVAVLDAGGHLVAFNREDRSGIMRAEVAMGKAWGALGMGVNTRLLRDRLADRPSFQAALAIASGGRFVPVPGGVLIRDADRTIIGAVGVSGDTSDKDEACAIAGIKAAGLRSDPAEPAEGWESSQL
ncbi:MAG: heme-binding protein [Alphaproteobacteria bacterium]|nr:heme-binding protein [Alphaproteobacteria bacterium]